MFNEGLRIQNIWVGFTQGIQSHQHEGSIVCFILISRKQFCGLVNVNVNIKIHGMQGIFRQRPRSIRSTPWLRGKQAPAKIRKKKKRNSVIHGEKELVMVHWCLPCI